MEFPRASGILLHPTSLPSEFGIGDFGQSAYDFVDFLRKSKQTYWQILPLCPTGFGDSPYQGFSAFAGNTNLISPKLLIDGGLLNEQDLHGKPDFPKDRVDFGKVIEWKSILLKKAHENFLLSKNVNLRSSFEVFKHRIGGWLNDYALFRAIKKSQEEKQWLKWDEPLRNRHEDALQDARESLSEEIQAQQFYQYLFFKQWSRLKNYANGKGIKIIGDVPIFVSLDSADVWCNPQEFKLNEDLTPIVVAGVPPDYFSKTGQLWGNPIYDWKKMEADGFKWWVSRVRSALKTVDILRIDHFRGFAGVWEVSANDKTAENGRWVDVPGESLLRALRRELLELPLMAEDLGVITDNVKKLRDDFGFPGMHILQYAFGGDARNLDLPHNYVKNSAVYTGTHDNETTAGWFNSKTEKDDALNEIRFSEEQEYCLAYINSNGKYIHWDMIRAAFASVADTAITPMQDVLGLDNKARMNVPASKSGNWNWRCKTDSFSDEIAQKLSELTGIYDRTNSL